LEKEGDNLSHQFANRLGKFNPNDDSQIIQSLPGRTVGRNVGQCRLFWNNNVLLWAEVGDNLKMFQL